MTNSPKKMLLWAYYTNHKECCVEFDVSLVDPVLLKPVEYVEAFSPHNDMTLEEIYSSLYRKGREWKHENEFRAVYYEKKHHSSCWKKENDDIYLMSGVKSVTFGLFSDRELPRYKKALETLIKYGIVGKKCRLRSNKYALEEDRQFDLETELERVNRSLEVLDKSKTSLSINSDERKLLRKISELQDADSMLVSFEKIAVNHSLLSGVQILINKGLVELQFHEEEGTYKFYYALTDLGKKYL